MLTDKQILRIVNHDLGDAAQELAPFLETIGIKHATITLAFHDNSDLPFILLFAADGPVLAFSPYVPEAQTFLDQELPESTELAPDGAIAWANRQRWDVVATRRITYVGGSANGR